MNWTSGYRADIDYTHGFYRELAPNLIDFVLLQNGFEPPVRDGPLRYLELGYGQGVTINIQGAAAPGEYWGSDFNPAHAAHAQSLARASGAQVRALDDSFAEILARDDLPQFDYIVAHGIWTWVSDANRQVIVDIFKTKLKVGGVAYLSYNSLPGWAMAMPIRHLLASHGKETAAGAGVVGKVDAALAFANQLAEANAGYFQANPHAKARLDGLAGQNRAYLAHEYLNDIWTPMYFSEVQERLSEAKLTFAAHAGPIENMDGFVLTPDQRQLLTQTGQGTFRETVRDYMTNTQFRRDLYIRGARRLTAQERQARIMDQRVTLLIEPDKLSKEIAVGAGKVQLNEAIYKPIVEAIGQAGVARLGDLEARLTDLPAGAVAEAAVILIGSGQAHLVQDEPVIKAATRTTQRLNAELVKRSLTHGDIGNLASPVIGSGVVAGRFEQLFIAARQAGLKTQDKWAEFAWEKLSAAGQNILHEGKALETPEENIAELKRQAKIFEDERLALFKRLKVVD